MPATLTLAKLRHPQHTLQAVEWEKFRLAFEGGLTFKTKYLKTFSNRESSNDYSTRREMSPVPAHAKGAILDVRNAIFKRMVDITRKDGPDSYTKAVQGLQHGVDGKGNSMNGYVGQVILPELLVMGRVGVYVDKPVLMTERLTLAEARATKPYLYYYQAEDIFSWHYDDENRLDAVLLRDHTYTVNKETGLVDGEKEYYRLLKKVDGGIEIVLYGQADSKSVNAKTEMNIIGAPIVLGLKEIPFVIMELDSSLMTDVADYQIAMMNLASSDINYAIKANFPFYTEQFHPAAELPHIRPAEVAGEDTGDGTSTSAEIANARQQKTGVTQGRRYPIGTDRPGFIHPSSEPLKASMELQEKMKKDIRQLVGLNLSNIQAVRASADSKQQDDRSLEGGLANIGLELEFGERNIGRIWWDYEKDSGGEITIKYPDNYSMRTDEDRRREAKELREAVPTIPSATFQKETTKDIITILQGHKISLEKLETMHKEVDESVVVITDPDILKQDHEAGFVGTKLASELRGYPEGQAAIAAIDHADRASRIVAAQIKARDGLADAQARGVPDLDDKKNSGIAERQEANDPTTQQTTEDRTRGEGK